MRRIYGFASILVGLLAAWVFIRTPDRALQDAYSC